ncbi:hypothetical protein LguiB_020812 [Lonicera macranthoides]
MAPSYNPAALTSWFKPQIYKNTSCKQHMNAIIENKFFDMQVKIFHAATTLGIPTVIIHNLLASKNISAHVFASFTQSMYRGLSPCGLNAHRNAQMEPKVKIIKMDHFPELLTSELLSLSSLLDKMCENGRRGAASMRTYISGPINQPLMQRKKVRYKIHRQNN